MSERDLCPQCGASQPWHIEKVHRLEARVKELEEENYRRDLLNRELREASDDAWKREVAITQERDRLREHLRYVRRFVNPLGALAEYIDNVLEGSE